MSGFGIGFGAFAEGLTKGMGVMRDIKHQDNLMKLQERRMVLQEQQYADQAEDRRTQRQWDAEDRAYTMDERKKNQPFVDLTRESLIGTLTDQKGIRDAERGAFRDAREGYDRLKGNSITRQKNAMGQDNYVFEGKEYGSKQEAELEFERRNGTVSDYFQKNLAPKVQEAYYAAGEYQKGDAFGNWRKDKRIENGIRTAGAIAGQINIGNWGGAAKSFNDIAKDPNYIHMGDSEFSAEALPAGEGAPNGGLRITIRDRKTGETQTRDLTDQAQALDLVRMHLSPEAVFEGNLAAKKAVDQAKMKEAEEARAVRDHIQKKQGESDISFEEDLKKQAAGIGSRTGGLSERDYYKAVNDAYDRLGETMIGKEWEALSEDEKWGKAKEEAVRQIGATQRVAQEVQGGGAAPASGPRPQVWRPQAGAAPANARITPPYAER